jgi:catechol 2,3-dioxygenase-like lactoylglutathione lyase family enzyme
VPEKQPPIEGIHEAALYTMDLDAAERFWRRLGFQQIGRADRRHVFFRAGRDLLLIFDSASTIRSGGRVPAHGALGPTHVAFAVPDHAALDGWRRRLELAEVAIEHEQHWPNGGLSLYFRDPAGNSIELITRGSWDTTG